MTPEFLITGLDKIDIDAFRARLSQARSEIASASQILYNPKTNQTTFQAENGKISFEYVRDRLVMQRDPTESDRSLWVGEYDAVRTGRTVENLAKPDFIKIIDHWIALLSIPRYFSGPLNTAPAPGDSQRLLAASYIHALHPEEPGGYTDVPLRNPYLEPKPEICYEGGITRWLDQDLAQHIIDQTPICVQLDLNTNSYEFGVPNSRNINCQNSLDPVERMRLLNDLKDIRKPIRKTKRKA